MTLERQERFAARQPQAATRPARRGAVVVVVAFVCLTLNAGFGFYSLSTYARFLVAHNGMSLTAASTGSTVCMLCGGLAGMAVARLQNRFDLRAVMLAGLALSAATVALIGLARQPWQLWLVYLGYGTGGAGISMIPASTLVMRWFGDAPARAMALATTGMSVGGAVVAPVVAALVARYGLPVAGWVMAAVLLVVLTPLVLVAMPPTRPADGRAAPAGRYPLDGDSGPADAAPAPPRFGFAAITVSFGLLMLSQVGAVTHMVTLAGERHIGNAAAALSVLAGTSVAGRLLGIPVLPHVGVYRFCVFNAALQAAAMVTLALTGGSTGLIVGAILLGVTVGNTVVLMPLVVLDVFGRNGYAPAYARANFLASFGIAFGPLLVGALHDHVGGYAAGLGFLGAGSALAAVVLAVLSGMRRRSPRPIPADRTTGGT